MKLVGDFAVKTDNQPKGINIGGFLHKTMRIAGSGLYEYHRREASLFGLDPKVLGDQEYFKILRKPEVLKRNKDMFARVPIITGSHKTVTTRNAKELSVGMVGDKVEYEVDPNDGELYLYTTGTIVTEEGVRDYEEKKQLSVGYVPTAHWEKGTYKGETYDAVLDDFKDVNHLLICAQARGGSQLMVMDSMTNESPLESFVDRRTKVLENIFKKKKDKKMVGDARVPVLLESIVHGADPKVQVAAVREIVGDTKSETFSDYLKELEVCGDEKSDVKKKAVDIVVDFYHDVVCGDSENLPKENTTGKETTPQDLKTNKKKKVEGDEEEEEEEEDKKDPSPEKKKEEPAGDSLETMLASFKKEILDSVKDIVTPKSLEVKENGVAVGLLTAAVAGDSSSDSKNKVSSDDIMNTIMGR